MSRPARNPETIETALRLNLGHLQRSGLFIPGQNTAGVIEWHSGSETVTAWLNIRAAQPRPVMQLYYCINGQQYYDTIGLVPKASNLNRGSRWYFVCPATGQRCLNLYQAKGGYFRHRAAYEYLPYRIQIADRTSPTFTAGQFLRYAAKADHVKPGRVFYAGSLTRSYQRWQRVMARAQQHAG